MYKTIQLPIDNPSKHETQTILHAVEELYFCREFDRAISFVDEALKGNLVEDMEKMLKGYKERCISRGERENESAKI